MSEITTFLSGILSGGLTVLVIAYGYIKRNGIKLNPETLSEDFGALTEEARADYLELLGDLNEALGNVSLTEAGEIIKRASELAAGGYTNEELRELAEMAIKAGKKNIPSCPPGPCGET